MHPLELDRLRGIALRLRKTVRMAEWVSVASLLASAALYLFGYPILCAALAAYGVATLVCITITSDYVEAVEAKVTVVAQLLIEAQRQQKLHGERLSTIEAELGRMSRRAETEAYANQMSHRGR